jgi:hypothetical protein
MARKFSYSAKPSSSGSRIEVNSWSSDALGGISSALHLSNQLSPISHIPFWEQPLTEGRELVGYEGGEIHHGPPHISDWQNFLLLSLLITLLFRKELKGFLYLVLFFVGDLVLFG